MSEHQAAEAAGVAAGTIKSRLSRALAAMAADPGLAALWEGTS
jgi:DNA-directed RNA polymerase specialized sigma24 family protein